WCIKYNLKNISQYLKQRENTDRPLILVNAKMCKNPDSPLIAQRRRNHNKSLRPLSWAKQTVKVTSKCETFLSLCI
ncbi:MAG: hypothetical protein ACJA2G_002953, partial [Cognaticolwellia sp.]